MLAVTESMVLHSPFSKDKFSSSSGFLARKVFNGVRRFGRFCSLTTIVDEPCGLAVLGGIIELPKATDVPELFRV